MKFVGQVGLDGVDDLFWDGIVEGFGDAARDAGEGVAVAAERDGQADGGLKIYGREVGHIRGLQQRCHIDWQVRDAIHYLIVRSMKYRGGRYIISKLLHAFCQR